MQFTICAEVYACIPLKKMHKLLKKKKIKVLAYITIK